jgi:hypothetical protein
MGRQSGVGSVLLAGALGLFIVLMAILLFGEYDPQKTNTAPFKQENVGIVNGSTTSGELFLPVRRCSSCRGYPEEVRAWEP